MEHVCGLSDNHLPVVAGIGLLAAVSLPSKLTNLGPRLVVDWIFGTYGMDVRKQIHQTRRPFRAISS